MITEMAIKAAIRNAPTSGKRSLELKDGGERGAGRLALIIRPLASTVAAEWYAVYYRNGKRVMIKIASYPTLSLGEARKTFREQYAPAISTGAEPTSPHARRRHSKTPQGTVKELFEAYVASLRAAGKRAADGVERILTSGRENAADAIGGERAASAVEPGDIVPFLSDIHARGSAVMASQARAYLSAAFKFGMRAEHDYTQAGVIVCWGLKSNPVAAIAVNKGVSKPGQRFLTPAELRTFWLWLIEYESKSRLAPALRLAAATGQRIEEIFRITETVYEKPRAMLYWEETKNGLPHAIPLPEQAVAILEWLPVNRHGLYFPHSKEPAEPAPGDALGHVVARFLDAHREIPKFIPRDMRRTWKTLAGDAGLSKEMRDLLQNHSRNSDVSSRHYDRYDYLAEKRAAMAQWAAYLALVITGEIKEIGQRESNVVPIGRAAVA